MIKINTNRCYNQRGQVTGYTLGNGLSTARGYDDFGFPTTIQTPGIQNLAYQFDTQTGNLNRREDVAKPLQEDFTYDNLMKNRLETWQVGSGTIYTTQYSSNGNIGSKTWLGNYQYESTRPHAVTGVDNTDGWIWGQNQSVDYTPFNKVRTIREGDYKLEIIYGPDNRRKKTILYRDANSTVSLKSVSEVINWVPFKTKYFVDGIYEEELVEALTNNTSEVNYVAGGDGLAAIFVKDDQGENLYYIHKDHLGSYQAVSDESGLLQEELYFSPWGNRGSATTWSYPLSQNEGFYGRGFTGHEHLPEFNLINMNSRVYDPILGRFLSPDNYIQLPDYTQSLNRYSYALNNPLIYTDPSGEFWQYLVAAAFFYLKSAHDNRDQETGKWDWNPFDKGSTFVAGVKTDTEFKEVTGYVAGGSGYYIPAFSYSSQNGPGIGYYSPQGSSFTYPGANHNRASEVVLREMNEVRQAYGSAWQNQSFDENGLLPPVDLKFPITSPYKKDNRIIPELGLNRPHLAIDIGTPIGTPVLSPWSGTVTMAQDTKYGLSVIVKHDYFYADNFIQTGYAHLSKINITKGLQINRGDTIGYTGIWGTGPHLHFTLRFGEKKVNPTILFPYK